MLAAWLSLRLIALMASLGPSSVSLMMSHISMLRAQFSLGKLGSVALSLKKYDNTNLMSVYFKETQVNIQVHSK